MLFCKKAIILFSLLMLFGCGFQPILGTRTGSEIRKEVRYIEISPIADRIGQQLRNHLVHDIMPLGGSSVTKYKLIVKLTESKQNLAIKKSEIATRANLRFNANYEIVLKSNGKKIAGGHSRMTTSYNILNQTFSTLMAEKNARKRAVREISADISSKIYSFFRLNRDKIDEF